MNKKICLTILAILLTILLGGGGILLSQRLAGTPQEDGKQDAQSSTETENSTGKMEVTFLDVGQGDCTIIRTEGHAMMVDAGNNKAGADLADSLKQEGIDTLDYLILTHPDADHIGGGDNVLESVKVKQVLMLNLVNETKTYEEVIHDIEEYQVKTIYPVSGETYQLGDASFTILSPEEGYSYDEGTRGVSVGIKLVHGEKSFVMCGDAEEKEEKNIVSRFGSKLECDVLKCGHHGSNTATCEEFLDACNPTWAIISCGEGNSYGHPHAEVIARLEDDDVQTYRTDQLGTVRAISDGKRITWSHGTDLEQMEGSGE